MKKLRHYLLKIARFSFVIGLFLLILVPIGVGVGLQWLQTERGQAYLVPKVVSFANKTIHGTVHLQHVSINLAGFFRIEGLTVLDPKQRKTVVLDKISGRLSYLSLVYLNPSISGLSVEGGQAHLVKETDGTWNLANAFSLKKPSQKNKEKSSFALDLNNVDVRGVDVTVSGFETAIEVKRIQLNSNLFYSAESWNVDLENLDLNFQQPVQRALSIQMLALGRNQEIEIKEFSMQSPELSVAALASYNLDSQAIDFTLKRLQVAAPLVRQYATVDLQENLVINGQATGTLKNLVASIEADAGRGGNLKIDLTGDVLNRGPLSVNMTAQNIDVAAYKNKTPSMVFNASVALRELGSSFARLDHLQVQSDKIQLTASGSAQKLENGWLPELQFSLNAKLPQHLIANGFIRNRQFDITSRYEAKPKSFLTFSTQGTVHADLNSVDFSRFELLMPKNNWTTTTPFRVVLKPTTRLQNFSFASGAQHLNADCEIKESGSLHAKLSLKSLQLAKLPYYILPKMNRLTGVVNAQALVRGTTSVPTGDISFSLKNGGVAVTQAKGKPQLVFDKIQLSGSSSLDAHILTASVDGSAFQTPVFFKFRAPRNVIVSPQSTSGMRLDVHVKNASIEHLLQHLDAYPRDHKIAGRATLVARIEGSVGSPTATVQLDVAGGQFDKIQNLNLATHVTASKKGFIELDATLRQSQQERVAAKISWQNPTQSGLPQSVEAIAHGPFNATVRILSIPLKQLTADENVSGNVAGTMRLSGTLNSPKLDSQIQVTQLGNQNIANGQGHLRATYSNQQAQVEVKFSAPGSNTLDLRASSSLNLGMQAILAKNTFSSRSPIDFYMNANLPDLSLFQPLVPGIKQLSGGIFAEVKGHGPLRQPKLDGRVYLTKSIFGIKGVRTIRIEKLNATIANDTLDLKELEIRSAGELSASGSIIGLTAEQKTYVLSLSTRALMLDPARYPSDTVDSRIVVSGNISPSLVTANVNVNQLRVWIPKLAAGKPVQSLKTHPDIVVVTGQEKSLPPTKEQEISVANKDFSKSPKILVQVNAPRNIFVQGPDLLLELMANLKINIENGQTLMDGNISNVRPGQLKFYGREIRLDETTINFRNEEAKNASLKLDATYPTSEATVMIEVRGIVSKPELKLKSDPPLPEFRIASLLIGGDRGDRPAEGQPTMHDRSSTIAANALGSFVSSKLESAFFPRSPLTLNVNVKDPNERSGDVSVGKYVNPNLFVSYERNFGTELYENISEVHFDYRLARRWSLEGFFGDAQEGGLDILWKKSF